MNKVIACIILTILVGTIGCSPKRHFKEDLGMNENSKQNKKDFEKTKIATKDFVEPDSSYYKVSNQLDSIWINALNEIKLPQYMQQDSVNIYLLLVFRQV